MTDTAQEATEFQAPVLDLEAMLADLHNDFPDEPEGETVEQPADEPTPAADAEVDAPDPLPELDSVLPPGYVQFGDEVLPEVEVKALVELNRRVKSDPDTASRVRQAVIGQSQTAKPEVDPDALPAYIDPDDQQAVYFYRNQQRIEREFEELKARENQRIQAQTQAQESARVTEVRDAFRTSMKEFRESFPQFDLTDLNAIANRAASMGLLEHPEKVGGTLKGGIVAALEAATYATPEFREKAVAGATVRTKEQQSQTRKQKSSALSSSTGSVVRTQSQEQTPTTRQEIMAAGLDFLRSGAVTD